MSKDDATVLQIITACQAIGEFVEGQSKESFVPDYKTQSAVLHQLLIIGEAAKRLSEDCRDSHPNLPWRAMAKMRDKLIHGYDQIDLDIVWKTAISEVPAIFEKLQ